MKGRLIATTKTFSIVSLPNWRIFTIHFGTREKRHLSFARWGNKRKRHGCYGSIAMNFPASAPFREHPHKKSLPNPCNSRKYFLSLPRQNRLIKFQTLRDAGSSPPPTAPSPSCRQPRNCSTVSLSRVCSTSAPESSSTASRRAVPCNRISSMSMPGKSGN